MPSTNRHQDAAAKSDQVHVCVNREVVVFMGPNQRLSDETDPGSGLLQGSRWVNY